MSDRVRVSSGSPWEPRVGISRALRAGDRVLVSGTAPIWPDGSCDPDTGAQTRRCLEIIVDALEEAAVVISPGSMYGPSGEGFFRIALTAPDDRIEEAVERMRKHLS